MGLFEFLSSNKDLISLIISALNLGVIVYFFISTRNYDLKSKEYEKKSVQFQSLVLSTNHEKLEEFYNHLYKYLSGQLERMQISISNESPIDEIVRTSVRFINEEMISLRKRFGDLVFAFDAVLGDKVYKHLETLQDSLTELLEEFETDKVIQKDNLESVIRSSRIQLFTILHNYEPINLKETGRVKYDEPVILLIFLFTTLWCVLEFF